MSSVAADKRPIQLVQLVTRLDTGGVPEQVLTLLEGLAQPEYAITVICREVSDRYRQRLEAIGARVILLKMHRLLHPSDVLAALHLYRLLRQLKCDILHTHTSKAALLGGIIGMAARVPVRVNTAHNLGCLALPQAVLRGLFWLYDKCLFTTMQGIITVSSRIRDRIVQMRVLPDSKAFAIPNGINPQPFTPNPQLRNAMRAELGIGEDELAIGCVARLVWFKGLDSLVAALPQVTAARKVRCWIVGEGPLKQALQEQAAQLGVADKLCFLGERSDIPALLNAFDVFVLPSVSEGMPITILEAMAAAKPVVATDVGGVGEMFEPGISGLLVPPRQPQALADALNRLLADDTFRAQVATAARARIDTYFTQQTMVAATDRLYRHLLLSRGKSDGAAQFSPR